MKSVCEHIIAAPGLSEPLDLLAERGDCIRDLLISRSFPLKHYQRCPSDSSASTLLEYIVLLLVRKGLGVEVYKRELLPTSNHHQPRVIVIIDGGRLEAAQEFRWQS
jgi:hypothetical protein